MAQATGYDAATYSVTLPPFPAEGPRSEWRPRLDPESLGLFSVGTIVSDYPLEAAGLEERRLVQGVYIYRNPQVRPRAWVQSEMGGGGVWRPVQSWEWSPNRIAVVAQGPGSLVFSEVFYPGWTAEIDGAPAAVGREDGILRAVSLTDGMHSIVLEFRPWRIGAGIAITLLTAASLAILWIRR
jgi:hypothetical protein